MFATAIRLFAKKPKPPMKPIELTMPPEQTQTVTRVIFDILKEHGPLTVGDTWERVKVVGLRGLTSKRHMKIVMRWMRERQKLKLICNHVGPQTIPVHNLVHQSAEAREEVRYFEAEAPMTFLIYLPVYV